MLVPSCLKNVGGKDLAKVKQAIRINDMYYVGIVKSKYEPYRLQIGINRHNAQIVYNLEVNVRQVGKC